VHHVIVCLHDFGCSDSGPIFGVSGPKFANLCYAYVIRKKDCSLERRFPGVGNLFFFNIWSCPKSRWI